MESHDEIEIALSDLVRDPFLPPRIVDDGRLEKLCQSLRGAGMAQPLVVRPDPASPLGGPRYLIILGYRRFLGAGRLGWEKVRAVVREDLDDQGVLQLAFSDDKTAESRTYLEDAWYYAAMHQGGMTQAAIADRGGFSVGKANMYVRVGELITPERIAAAGLDLSEVGELAITKLASIVGGPEGELDAHLVEAVQSDSEAESAIQPSFEWKTGRNESATAVVRNSDLVSWSSKERIEAIEHLGPLVAEARQVEELDDPEITSLRTRLERAHREALLEVRESHNEQLIRLMEINTNLLLALNRGPEQRVEANDQSKWANGVGLWRLFRSILGGAARRLRRDSTVESNRSMVEDTTGEDDSQIAIGFPDERAA